MEMDVGEELGFDSLGAALPKRTRNMAVQMAAGANGHSLECTALH